MLVVLADARFDPKDVRRAYGRGFASCSETFGAAFPPESVQAGISDFVSVMAVDGDGSSLVLGRTLDRPMVTDAPLRARWRKVGAHMTAALRLRGTITRLDEQAAAAYFTPDGACLHATDDARDQSARAQLRTAIARRERARLSGRHDVDEVLDLWQGLVEGRWSLVDAHESDGKRYVVAHRNPPMLAPVSALTKREREVVMLLVLGRSTKDVAYSLGVASSAVSHTLTSALKRLRVRSVAHLVAHYNHLRANQGALLADDLAVSESGKPCSAPPSLTAAEAAVYALLVEGATNARIAEVRGTSERTVANQVASILRKLGAGSRRAVSVQTRAVGDHSGMTCR